MMAMAFSRKKPAQTMAAGITPQVISAAVGTRVLGDRRLSTPLPMTISSRAKEYSKRLAAACRLSTQETNDTVITAVTSCQPVGPKALTMMVYIGSLSSPEITLAISGTARINAKAAKIAAPPPM
ncbi:hypothetical protein D3C76_1535780 [compost metagenome]